MIPSTLLHYRIIQPLGSGGMGDVYVAEDTKLGRRVALKVLPHGQSGDPERRQRFEREARAIAALNHPNIVTIHAVESTDGITFLTMELVDGTPLSAQIPSAGLPIDRLLRIAIPLADAVAAAHERGITHRDLKPANVMLGPDGRVKVLDFGLARLEDVNAPTDTSVTTLKPETLTGDGRIVGTVAYMSPEQAEGKPLDHRTDLFSLGVMIYEMATGVRPFKGETTVSLLSSILRDSPAPITEVNAAMPRDLARIVRRALAKDREQRYQTAKDLRNDLEILREELTSGALSSPAASPAPITSDRPARSRAMIYGVAAAVLVVAAVVAWLMLGGSTTTSSNTATSAAPFEDIRLTRLTNAGTAGLTAMSPDGRYVAHVVGQTSLYLRQIATSSSVQIVPPGTARFDGVSFSRDGNFIYYVVYPSGQNFSVVYQVPVLGGTPRRIMDDVDTPLAFSPDGSQFAFVRGYSAEGEYVVFTASADGTNERRVATRKNPVPFLLNTIAWSPDGKTLLAVARVDLDGQQKVVAIDVATGAETIVSQGAWEAIDSVAWLPTGQGFVATAIAAEPNATTQIWHFTFPGGEPRRITNDLNSYTQVTVSSDGGTMAAVQQEGLAHLWVAALSSPDAPRQITSGPNRADGAAGVAWTRDGRIVYSSNASGNFDIWIADADGRNARALTDFPGFDGLPRVTPDGRSIVFISTRPGGSIWMMDIEGGAPRVLVSDRRVGRAVVSPDQKWIYYSSFSNQFSEVYRQPFGGGAAERLTAPWPEQGFTQEGAFYHPAINITGIAPDGQALLGYHSDLQVRGFRLGLFPVTPGTPRRLDIATDEAVFTADGKSLLYRDFRTGPPNLFRKPASGGPGVQLTSFKENALVSFALSQDGKQVVMSRGRNTSDVVLIRNER